MKRYLITTAEERSWKFDRPVVFLGEWCRLYNRRDVWSSMDAIVAKPFGIDAEQKLRNHKYIEKLLEQMLKELTIALNEFHGTNFTQRYWHIILGHWLMRYIEVIFNRYFTIDQMLKNCEVSASTFFISPNFKFARNDSYDFIDACRDDIWNHCLYTEILNFFTENKIEVETFPVEEKKLDTEESRPVKMTVKNIIFNLVNFNCSESTCFK